MRKVIIIIIEHLVYNSWTGPQRCLLSASGRKRITIWYNPSFWINCSYLVLSSQLLSDWKVSCCCKFWGAGVIIAPCCRLSFKQFAVFVFWEYVELVLSPFRTFTSVGDANSYSDCLVSHSTLLHLPDQIHTSLFTLLNTFFSHIHYFKALIFFHC